MFQTYFTTLQFTVVLFCSCIYFFLFKTQQFPIQNNQTTHAYIMHSKFVLSKLVCWIFPVFICLSFQSYGTLFIKLQTIFRMSCCKLRTPWPIHFKFHRVIGIDGLMVCILFGEISIFHSRVMRLYSSNCRRFIVCRAVN